jgi:hypothetical protein
MAQQLAQTQVQLEGLLERQNAIKGFRTIRGRRRTDAVESSATECLFAPRRAIGSRFFRHGSFSSTLVVSVGCELLGPARVPERDFFVGFENRRPSLVHIDDPQPEHGIAAPLSQTSVDPQFRQN